MPGTLKITLSKYRTPGDKASIYVDDKPAGHYYKAKHGPGYFVHVDGKTWRTAAGARYHQERDAEYQYAYAPNLKLVKARVKQALETEGVLRNKQ